MALAVYIAPGEAGAGRNSSSPWSASAVSATTSSLPRRRTAALLRTEESEDIAISTSLATVIIERLTDGW